MSPSVPPTIWLIKDAEPLPLQGKQRLMRTGLLAEELHKRGYDVVWFASRFEHARKVFVEGPATQEIRSRLTIKLLEGPGYTRNISFARIKHQQALASSFIAQARDLPAPALVVVCCPCPELCLEACRYAHSRGIPVYVDARDPWPDSFADYFPKPLRFLITPVVVGYRKILRECFSLATGVTSMSRTMLAWALSYSGRPRGVKDGVFYLGYRLPHQVRTIEVPTTFTAEQPLELSFVGTFGKSYDIRSIFEALRLLSPDERSRIRCRLVGKGDYLEHWQRKSRDLPCVSFEGWKDEKGLVEVLASSHVGLIPIKGGVTQFWMGNKLFEYAAFGVALINSVPNEAAMLIEQNDFGINVNPGDSAGIAQALRGYLANPSLLTRHRENARTIFNQKFDAQRIYAEFADHVLKGIRSAQSEDVLSQAV